MAQETKVKLVAIAKDEAAYLPEWVFHHLACGFDSIDVYINRTSDNSFEILDNIAQHYPQVSAYSADWIDQCGGQVNSRMQFVVYAKAFDEIKREGKYTHVAFLDIDEFFIHQDAHSVTRFIQDFSKEDVIYLEWLIDIPSPQPFSVLSAEIDGNLSVLGKCIVPVTADVHRFRLHCCMFHNEQAIVLADRSPFIVNKDAEQALAQEASSLKRCFIYHRANRSEIEYISLTRRGRPSSNFAYKENRKGLTRANDRYHKLKIFEDEGQGPQDFAAFIDKCDLSSPLRKGQVFVQQRYEKAIEGLASALAQNYAVMKSIFTHVKDERVISAFKAHRRLLSEASAKDAGVQRDLAKDAQHQDIEEAVYYIEKALALRPEGPKIIELHQRFTERLLKQKAQQKTQQNARELADNG